MNTRRLIFGLVSILAIFFCTHATAADFVRQCGTCNSASQASAFAQMYGHNLTPGRHAIYVVNLNNTNAWKVEIRVVVTGGGFEDITVTVLSTQAATQPVIDSFDQLKAIGLTQLSKDVTLSVVLTPSQLNGECLSASGGPCANVVNILQALPDTLTWAASVGTIGVLWTKVAEFLFSVAGPQLQYVVTFPDGSVEIYYFLGQGQGTGFDVRPNTTVTPAGTPLPGGTLQGWSSLVPGGLSGAVTVRVLGATIAGGSNCRSYTITIVSESEVSSVSGRAC